jgi:hypothetical protein
MRQTQNKHIRQTRGRDNHKTRKYKRPEKHTDPGAAGRQTKQKYKRRKPQRSTGQTRPDITTGSLDNDKTPLTY